MNQIVLLIGLLLVMIIVFWIIARVASLAFKVVLLLILAVAGYVWWQYVH